MTFREAMALTTEFAANYDLIRKPNNPTDQLLLNPRNHVDVYKSHLMKRIGVM
jgi:hypothetical protein